MKGGRREIRTIHPVPYWEQKLNSRIVKGVFGVLLLGALISIGAWYRSAQAQQNLQDRLLANTLGRVAALLQEQQGLLTELQHEPYSEKDSGILESYLIKIRRDGVTKNAAMKQRLDQLSENNTAIVARIEVYSALAKSESFATEADKFRNYASAWRDRWNSVMELFMAGGNYPAAGVSFPEGFPAAVRAEVAASR